MEQKLFRWGIMGAGRIAHNFAQSIDVIPGATVYAIGSRTIEKAKSFALEHNIDKAYATYEELVNDPKVDAIYIATPHVFHCENTLLCLENKKPVLCEKPFAMNEWEVQKMIESAHKNETFLMEALWTRFLPWVSKVQEILNSGLIGDVVFVRGDFCFSGNKDPKARLLNPDLGGGAILDIGIYPVFVTLLFLGYPDKIHANSVKAVTGVDETTAINLYYDDGKMASLMTSISTETPTEFDIFGTKGRIKIHSKFFMPVSISVFDAQFNEEKIDFPYIGNGYNYEAVEVQKCLEMGLKESSLMSHNLSMNLIRLLDSVRVAADISYSADEIQF